MTDNTHNHAHIQNSGNSGVRLNVDSDVRTNQDAEVDSNVRTRQNYSNSDLLNSQLLSSLIPLLNRLVRNNQD